MVKMPTYVHILIILFLAGQAIAVRSAPPVGGTEVSATRVAHFQDGLLQREFDFSGQKGYWIDGISLLGQPDFNAQTMGFAQPARRLPTGLSGLYTREPGYSRYGLTLNGVQGQATQGRYTAPIDTPTTRLVWERYGFEGNAFHLDFRRLLTDSVGFDLGVASHSTSASGVFRYQDIVHQPYTGTLKRDSSRVPFVGRNLAYGTMHLKPAVTWYFPRASFAVQSSFLSIDNDDATRHLYTRDSATLSVLTFQTLPWNVQVDAKSVGAEWNWRPREGWELSASHRFSFQQIRSEKTPSLLQRVDQTDTTYFPVNDTVARDTVLIDSVFYPAGWDENYAGKSGEWSLARAGLLNPALRLEYEFLDTEDWLDLGGQQSGALYQDRQTGWLQLKDTLDELSGDVQLGMQRNGSAFDEVDWAPAFAGTARLRLPYRLSAHGAWQRDTRFPDVTETHVFRTGRLAYPNAALKPEERDRREGRLEWDGGGVFYGLGIRSESADNLICPLWTTQYNLAKLSPNVAFLWANRRHVESRDWFMRSGFRLGNWQLFGERGATLDRTRKWDVPSHYYKGSVVWGNRFVEERLGVSVRWDAQWFGNRYDYAIDKYNMAVPVELRHYLVLNFEARMQISNFELYTRIDNMNHSLLEPEAGYAPPGMSFRYGIQWALGD